MDRKIEMSSEEKMFECEICFLLEMHGKRREYENSSNDEGMNLSSVIKFLNDTTDILQFICCIKHKVVSVWRKCA